MAVLGFADVASAQATRPAPAPVYRDPITDGAADPSLVWNDKEKSWWMLYTQRRANVEAADVAYVYGTPIAAASSTDGGRTWSYRGTLNLDFEPGMNTWWAPAVLRIGDDYHMWVAFIPGVRNHWGGQPVMQHYVSKDLWTWERRGKVELPAKGPIDAYVQRLDSGVWRMWYKDDRSRTSVADSTDLKTWTPTTRSTVTDRAHEGAIVFKLGGWWWMVVDQWAGMAVYRSKDTDQWERVQTILDRPSGRMMDGPSGAHGDVVVSGDRAFIFYFTHPGRNRHGDSPMGADGIQPLALRRSVIQVAELRVEESPNGPRLVEKRDGATVDLPAGTGN